MDQESKEDNVFKLGVKVKPESPVAAQVEALKEAGEKAECIDTVKRFLEAHLEFLKQGKFEAHGVFIAAWNIDDGSYLMNDAGAYSTMQVLGMLDIAHQDYMARHFMHQAKGGK